MTEIVETGAVIVCIPFDGKWSPCVRRDGETWAKKFGPYFDNADKATKYADEYRRLDLLAHGSARAV